MSTITSPSTALAPRVEIASSLTVGDRERLETHAEIILENEAAMRRSALERAIAIGRELTAAKTLLQPYGLDLFYRWTKIRLGLKRDTAKHYLEALEFADKHPKLIENFDLSAIRIVFSAKHRQAIAGKALRLANRGERVTKQVARRLAGLEQKPLAAVPQGASMLRQFDVALDHLRRLRQNWPCDAREVFEDALRELLAQPWPASAGGVA